MARVISCSRLWKMSAVAANCCSGSSAAEPGLFQRGDVKALAPNTAAGAPSSGTSPGDDSAFLRITGTCCEGRGARFGRGPPLKGRDCFPAVPQSMLGTACFSPMLQGSGRGTLCRWKALLVKGQCTSAGSRTSGVGLGCRCCCCTWGTASQQRTHWSFGNPWGNEQCSSAARPRQPTSAGFLKADTVPAPVRPGERPRWSTNGRKDASLLAVLLAACEGGCGCGCSCGGRLERVPLAMRSADKSCSGHGMTSNMRTRECCCKGC